MNDLLRPTTGPVRPGRGALRLGAGCLLALVAALAAGCGESLPPAADSEQARQALTMALDAWKGGGTPETLASGSPPIRVIDRDWQEGRKLLTYELLGQGQGLGLNHQCPVRLTLEDARGKKALKQITYVVSPGEPLVISRLDVDF